MKSTLLITIIIGTCLSVELSLTTRCSCNEFDSQLCYDAGYCTMIDGICSPNQCNLLQKECTDIDSEFQCKWNYQKEICEDHVYECSELDKFSCFIKRLLLECYYDTVDETCKAFGECTQAKTDDDCHPFDCSYSITEGCQDRKSSLHCDGTDESSCKGWDGEGAECEMNDKYECAQQEIFIESCSYYENGFMNNCKGSCKIDETNKCVQKTCQDFTSETCVTAINIMDFTFTPCIWSNSSCKEATDQELENMGAQCIQNYKWNSDSGKCSACESFVDQPIFSNLKKIRDNLSYSIILDVILISSIMLN